MLASLITKNNLSFKTDNFKILVIAFNDVWMFGRNCSEEAAIEIEI